MKDLRWIYAGTSVGLAGVIALAIAAAPSGEPAGTASMNDAISPVATAPVSAPPAPATASKTVVAPAKPAPVPAPRSGIVPGSAGMVIAIDPETGDVGMPTPEQLADLKLNENEAVMHEDAGLLQVQHADGHWSMDLQGRYQEYAVIRKAADGTTTIGCVDHPANADHVHPAPAGLEEE
jgi:hypothetical protein